MFFTSRLSTALVVLKVLAYPLHTSYLLLYLIFHFKIISWSTHHNWSPSFQSWTTSQQMWLAHIQMKYILWSHFSPMNFWFINKIGSFFTMVLVKWFKIVVAFLSLDLPHIKKASLLFNVIINHQSLIDKRNEVVLLLCYESK